MSIIVHKNFMIENTKKHNKDLQNTSNSADFITLNQLFYNPCLITLTLDEAKSDPCQPDPCGPGALASVASNTGLCSCSCPPGLQGDPYVTGCRPECLINADCPRDKACSSNTCTDPCPGTCGTAATCSVINHVPTCVCDKGYVGNAFEQCVKRKHDI